MFAVVSFIALGNSGTTARWPNGDLEVGVDGDRDPLIVDLGASYRLIDSDGAILDFVSGGRMLDVEIDF